MVCAHVGRSLHERFHRHGFFFLNYAYSGDYQALSHERDNLVTISEGQMYVGQPFSGYALRGNAEEDVVILGVLVRAETFYRDFLPLISSDSRLLEFFLGPRNNLFSDQFGQTTMPEDSGVCELLEMMAVEYAEHRPDAQLVLKPLALALVTKVAREWRQANKKAERTTVAQRVLEEIARDPAGASLAGLAQELGYHPNYLSTLVRKETGSSFSQLVLDQRMGRASMASASVVLRDMSERSTTCLPFDLKSHGKSPVWQILLFVEVDRGAPWACRTRRILLQLRELVYHALGGCLEEGKLLDALLLCTF